MKMICAWCDRPMGGRGSVISHGICKRCFADMFQPQFHFMESIPIPGFSAMEVRRRTSPRTSRLGHAQPELFSITA